jgi:hypothetical protein
MLAKPGRKPDHVEVNFILLIYLYPLILLKKKVYVFRGGRYIYMTTRFVGLVCQDPVKQAFRCESPLKREVNTATVGRAADVCPCVPCSQCSAPSVCWPRAMVCSNARLKPCSVSTDPMLVSLDRRSHDSLGADTATQQKRIFSHTN